MNEASLKIKASGVPNARVIRELEFLSQFSYSIELCKGDSPEMNLADSISRLTRAEDCNVNIINLITLKLPFFTKAGITHVEFSEAQRLEKDLLERNSTLRNANKGPQGRQSRIRTTDGIVEIKRFGKWLPIVPQSLIKRVFEFFHYPGHNSRHRMSMKIRQELFVPNLDHLLRLYAKSCEKCMSVFHQPNTKSGTVHTTTSDHPLSHANVDLVGPLPRSLSGNVYILTFIDLFTRYIEFRALPSKTAESVVEALNSIFCVRGPPLRIQFDNGREFRNELVGQFLESLGISPTFSTPYKPDSNAHAERANYRLKQMLILLDVPELQWDEYLPTIQLGCNYQTGSDGFCPFQRMHGWIGQRTGFLAYDPTKPLSESDLGKISHPGAKELAIRMTKFIIGRYSNEEKSKMEKQENSEEQIQIGDKVLVKTLQREAKMFSPWKGTYRIVGQADRNTFWIKKQQQPRGGPMLVERKRIRVLKEFIPENEENELTNKDPEEMPDHFRVRDAQNVPTADFERPRNMSSNFQETENIVKRPQRKAKDKANENIKSCFEKENTENDDMELYY